MLYPLGRIEEIKPVEVLDKKQDSEVLLKPIQSKKENNFMDFYNSLKKILDTYPYADYDPFHNHL